MIHRTLPRQPRVSCAKSRYLLGSLPIVPQSRVLSLQKSLRARCYSSTDTLRGGTDSGDAAVDLLQPDREGIDSSKTELELKNREIIDLKVSSKLQIPRYSLLLASHVQYLGQISPLGGRISQSSGTHKARCSIRP